MNIPSRFNKLHSFYGKAKYAFLAVFALTILFSAFVSARVYGESVIGTVQTKIVLNIDGKTKNIETTQNTIGGALTQNGINLDKNDITNPPTDTYLSGKNLDVSVIRAVPVLISDSGQSWPARSAYTAPEDILKQLAVEIFPEDKVSVNLILDPVTEGAVGQKVVIKRAPVYNIYVDDLTKVVRSWVLTVGDLLAEKGITLGANDVVEPGLKAPLVGVKEITITRINYADVEEIIAIPFKTNTQNDFNLSRGQNRTVQQGIAGSKNVTYHIVYKNGVEVSRTATGSEVTSQPISKTIARGVMPTNDTYNWWPTIVSAAARYGVDPVGMYDVMYCESKGNRFTGTSHLGLFQYSPDTWAGASRDAGYGGRLITDGEAQIYVTAWKVNHDGGWRAWSCKPWF